jgi:hypothetical protein
MRRDCVSKSECAPQRVVVSLGEGLASAAPSSATGRFFVAPEAEDVSGVVWHKLRPGESCKVPPKTGLAVLTAVGSDMRGGAYHLMFRGEGRLTGPLIYRERGYLGVRWAARLVAISSTSLTILSAVVFGLFHGFDEIVLLLILDNLMRVIGPLCLAAAVTMFALSYRKTRVFKQPDLRGVDVGIEAVPAEVRP